MHTHYGYISPIITLDQATSYGAGQTDDVDADLVFIGPDNISQITFIQFPPCRTLINSVCKQTSRWSLLWTEVNRTSVMAHCEVPALLINPVLYMRVRLDEKAKKPALKKEAGVEEAEQIQLQILTRLQFSWRLHTPIAICQQAKLIHCNNELIFFLLQLHINVLACHQEPKWTAVQIAAGAGNNKRWLSATQRRARWRTQVMTLDDNLILLGIFNPGTTLSRHAFRQ